MSVVESGWPLSKWSQFWIGTLQLLSCGMYSRKSQVNPHPSNRENSSEQYSVEPSGEEATVPHVSAISQAEHQPLVQPPVDTMCLMDLSDVCLLKIIDRLPFLDRLRFRVNKRLYALEPHAASIANVVDRIYIRDIEFMVREDQAHIRGRDAITGWLMGPWYIDHTVPLISGLLMLKRVIKCYRMTSVLIKISPEHINEIFKTLQFLKAKFLRIDEMPGIFSSSIPSLISSIRNNQLISELILSQPQNWATFDQLLMLMKVAQESLYFFELIDLSLPMVEKIGHCLMGIGPSFFENPPSDLSTIRTTLKDKKISILTRNRYNFFGISVEEGSVITSIWIDKTQSQGYQFGLIVGDLDSGVRYTRVPYAQEE